MFKFVAAAPGAALALTAVFTTGLAAETLSTRSRTTLFSSQIEVLDGRAAAQYSGSVRLQPPRVEIPSAAGSGPQYNGRYAGPYLDMARSAARRNRVPEDLFLRLVHQESRWNPRARSRAGALGLAQLMPATARRLGVDPFDPYQNLDGGARYLRQQYEEFGTWRLALAAYNAGPGAVQRYGGVPPYRETRNYVRVVWGQLMKGVWRYVFLGIALFVALIGGIVYLAIRLTQPYVDVVKQQGAALSQGDGAAAYDALALTTRDQISEAEFVIMMQDLGLWEDSGEYYFNARNVENGVARLSGTYTRADGAVIPVTFVIVQEQDEMRIISFQFGA